MKISLTENDILRHLSFRKLKLNPLKNIILVISIFLTTVLFTSVFTIALSLNKSIEISALRQVGGEADISFKYLTYEAEKKIASNDNKNIKKVGKSIILGLANNSSLIERQCEMRYADDEYAKMSFDYPTKGQMPKEKREIATDTLVLDMLGIPHKLGEKVELEFVDINGNPHEDKFVLCGFWEADKIAPASQIWMSKEYLKGYWSSDNKELNGLRMLSIKTDNKYDSKKIAKEILEEERLQNIDFNTSGAYSEISSTEKINIMLALGGMFFFIILSGYLIISNIYQISIVKEINFYGSLKLIGATSRQIKKLSYVQTVPVAIVGVSLGLIMGYLIGYLLLPPILDSSLGRESLNMSMSPIIFIGSILCTIFTVWISSRKALKVASKVSPINASKYFDSNFVKHKNRKYINIPRLSWINLFRHKKRVIMVICSLVMSTVLFESTYLIGNSFDLDKYIETKMVSDYSLSDYCVSSYTRKYEPNNTVTLDMLSQIKAINSNAQISNMYFDIDTVSFDDQDVYDKVIRKHKNSNKEYEEEVEKLISKKIMQAKVYGIDADIINKCAIFSGEFSPKEFEHENYVLAIGYDDDSDYEVIYEIGDKVKIKNSIYTVMGYVDIPDTVLGSIPEESAPLTQGFVMSTNSFMKLHGEPSIYQSFINVSDNKNRKIQKLLNEFQKDNANLDVKSKQTYAKEFQMQIFSQTALGYMMSIIVGLIGIMNYINTAASSIISRRHEFVILHSIGMTKRQLKNMLLLENIYIVSLVSIFSIMLSSVLGRTFVKSIIETSWCSSYRFAVWPLFAVLLLYFGILIIMPLLLIRNQEGESIVFRMKQLTDSY